ncbi:transposase domain-containing protein [Streptomyces sp. NBC_00287]|uniref:transposase domain-containing protein n=1 Tax=Streptomyces sp. NBC_00287 TaxID=2975702 RepID=UPI003FA7A00E
MAACGRVEQRKRLLPARLVVYFVLGLALFSPAPYLDVMRHLVEGLRGLGLLGTWHVPAKSSLFGARQRLGPEPLRVLFTTTAKPMGTEATPGAFWRGLRLLAVDGTCWDVADSPAADGTGNRRLTPWSLRAGDRADWSPDGASILLTTYPDGPRFAPGGAIYTIRPDVTGLHRLTKESSTIFYGLARFAPDGKHIMFAQARSGGNADLYIMKRDGSDITQITKTPQKWESGATWGQPHTPDLLRDNP